MANVRAHVLVFWTVQATALLAFVVPFSWSLAGLGAASYLLRMLGITLGFHRYFAHRTFQMGRPLRFFWALLGTTAMQKGPIWWASKHVAHHRFADRDGDPHSPGLRGFYYAHVGWFLDDPVHDPVDSQSPVLRDFGVFPEIRLLDRLYWLPPLLFALVCALARGGPGVVWGFCVPTFLLSHATFAINTVNHMLGSRRFDTPDDSRNNVVTALLTLGEGWHNNHHRYQRAARNGFYWWELDPTYYLIRLLGLLRVAWAIEPVPERVYREAAGTRPQALLDRQTA
jgi:stearoyl-CoA desaturase (delta-9 desaturase)